MNKDVSTVRPTTPKEFTDNQPHSKFRQEHIETLKNWEAEPDIKKSYSMFKQDWLMNYFEFRESVNHEEYIIILEEYADIYKRDEEAEFIFGKFAEVNMLLKGTNSSMGYILR